jgi:hypothetical protein
MPSSSVFPCCDHDVEHRLPDQVTLEAVTMCEAAAPMKWSVCDRRKTGSRRSVIGKDEEETGEPIFCLHLGGGGEMRVVDLVWQRMEGAWSGQRRPGVRAHGGGWGVAGLVSGAHRRHIRRSGGAGGGGLHYKKLFNL